MGTPESPRATMCMCEPVGRSSPGTKGVLWPGPKTFHLLAESLEPPRFIKEPKDQIGVSGGVASFVCQATGDPKPRVTWNKKGKKVNSQRFEVSQGQVGGALNPTHFFLVGQWLSLGMSQGGHWKPLSGHNSHSAPPPSQHHSLSWVYRSVLCVLRQGLSLTHNPHLNTCMIRYACTHAL